MKALIIGVTSVLLIVLLLLFMLTDYERMCAMDYCSRQEKIISKMQEIIGEYEKENAYYRCLLERNNIDYD